MRHHQLEREGLSGMIDMGGFEERDMDGNEEGYHSSSESKSSRGSPLRRMMR